MSNKIFSSDEIDKTLGELVKSRKFQNAGKMTELTGDELGAVTGGVGAWAFEFEGVVWAAICNKSETTNAMLENCLKYKKACEYASSGALSCLDCQHLYMGDMGVRVE